MSFSVIEIVEAYTQRPCGFHLSLELLLTIMAVGRRFFCSPRINVFFICCVISNGFLNEKTCVRNSNMHQYSAGGIKDLEKIQNLRVVSLLRFRHLGLDFGTRLKGYFTAGVIRYPNSISTFNVSRLVQCGDIEINPGPDQLISTIRKKPAWKFPCDVCTKPVRSNQKGILCDNCNKWCHFKCVSMDIKTYIDLGSSDEQWLCDKNCGWPFDFTDSFFESSSLSESNLNLSSSSTEVSVECSSRSSSGFSKCLLLNTRSVRNKIFDLSALLLIDSFNIVALTETWLDGNFDDRELHLEGYNIFRRDRSNQYGGGVLLAIKSDLHCVRTYDLEVNTEMLACELRISNTRCLLFAVFYRPPGIGEGFLEEFRKFLNNASKTGIADLVITGDFNFPYVDWSTCSPTTAGFLTETFCEILDDYFLTQTN